MLDFHCSKISNFSQSEGSMGSACLTVPNFTTIGQTIAEIWQYFDFFFKMTAPPSWIFKMAKF